MKKKKVTLYRKLLLQKERITQLHQVRGGDGPNGSAGCNSIFMCDTGNDTLGICYSQEAPTERVCPLPPPVTVSCGPAYCANPDTYVSCAAGPGCAVPATNGAGPCQVMK